MEKIGEQMLIAILQERIKELEKENNELKQFIKEQLKDKN